MMCARLLHHRRPEEQGRFYRASERAFQADHRLLRPDAGVGARHQTATLLVAVGDPRRHGPALRRRSRRASSRSRTPASSSGISEAPQTVSFAAMAERQQALARVILEGPGRREPLLVHRHRRDEHDAQQRAHPDQPEAARGAEGQRQRRHPAAPARAGEGRGHHALPAAGAGPDRRGPGQPDAVPVQPRGRRTRRSSPSGRRASSTACRPCPSCATWRATSRTTGLQARLVLDRDHGLAARHHAADARRRALRRLRPAAGLDDVHAAQPVPRRPRGRSPGSRGRRTTCSTVYVRSASGRRRPARRLHALSRRERAARREPPGPVPGRRRSRSTSRPAPRSARRSARSRRRSAELGLPAQRPGQLPGDGPGLPAPRSTNQPFLILAAARDRLHRARRALRELHPPAHDPLDAALGRRRRAARR